MANITKQDVIDFISNLIVMQFKQSFREITGGKIKWQILQNKMLLTLYQI
jgi:hypothetical protein